MMEPREPEVFAAVYDSGIGVIEVELMEGDRKATIVCTEGNLVAGVELDAEELDRLIEALQRARGLVVER